MLTANQEIPEHLLNTSEAVECPLQAGQMSELNSQEILLSAQEGAILTLIPQVHDGLTVHGSEPNLSTRRRCGFVIRYVPTSAYPVQDPDRSRTFNTTVLVSGVDEYHHFPNNAPNLQ
ncbi:UNVERIFIED_CONTAM: hypothetical protein FKN15_024565 [Acipenser sinensis]